ncbi:MAG: transposase [Steroidobacteraceae bacterium]
MAQLERQLTAAAHESDPCTTLLTIPGVGLPTATALVVATGARRPLQGRTPFRLLVRPHAQGIPSGSYRYLGRISKRGDRYLRMLLTHGARAVIRAATVSQRLGRPLDPLRQWAPAVQSRANHNKATCAFAEVARICFATPRDHAPYGAAPAPKKLTRQAFPMPA